MGLSMLLMTMSSAVGAASVQIFAAASLQTALVDVLKGYDGQVGVSWASSSMLARQIAMGAPAGLFLSANDEWMDWLEERSAINPQSRTSLVGNQLVLFAKRDVGFDYSSDMSIPKILQNASDHGKLAIGAPDHVPVGLYARQALQTMGLWDKLKTQLVPAENAPAVVRLVHYGVASIGIAYATDIKGRKDVRLLASIDPTTHKDIVYSMALTTHSDETMKRLYDYLRSEKAQKIFISHGFLPGDPS